MGADHISGAISILLIDSGTRIRISAADIVEDIVFDNVPIMSGIGSPPILLAAFSSDRLRLNVREPMRGPGKAVRSRRDPVTVIGDETRKCHWP